MKMPARSYISQCALFLSFFFCNASRVNAQMTGDSTQREDSFMIWTGHWQPHGIFIADNGAVITYDSIKRKPVFTMPAARNPMQHSVDEVNNTGKEEDDLEQDAHKDESGYKNYPIIKEAVKYYEKLKEETKNAVLKDIDWGNDDQLPPSGMGPTALTNFILNQCSKLKPDYDDVVAYAKSLKGKKDFDLPVPPAADYFNCWACNQKKRDEFDTLVDHYTDDFYKEDAKRLKVAFSILRNLQLLGRATSFLGSGTPSASVGGDLGQAIDDAFGTRRHPTACSYLNDASDELNKAIRIIVLSGMDKANALWKKYKRDAQRLRPIIVVVLSMLREVQMLGLSTGKEEDDFFENAEQFIQKLYEDWSDKLIKDHDYSKLADIPFILGMAREAEMLGGGPKDFFSQQKNSQRFNTLINFDRFKFTIDLSTKVGENQNYDNLHFHSEGYVIAIFDSTDCVHWVPAGLQAQDKNMFLPVNLLVAEKAYIGSHPEYTGTHNYFIPLNLKTHFCDNEGKDTMIFPISFLPDPPTGSTWVSEGKTIHMAADEYGISIFKDAQKYKDEIVTQNQNSNSQDAEEKKRKNQELLDKMNQLKASGMDKQQMMEEMSKLIRQASSNSNASSSRPASQLAFPIHFQNKNSVLIDEKFDAKKLNPSMADKIVYGNLTIKLEHAPGGAN
jgi:hypothetical protein